MPETEQNLFDSISSSIGGIRGIEHLDAGRLASELERGARFVSFSYCVSIFLVTFRRTSEVIYLPPETVAQWVGSRYLIVTLLLGWWALPWGPIYALGCIWQALRGGADCTHEIVEEMDLIFPDGFADADQKHRMREAILAR
jgi:hypothetical protein